MRFNREKYIDLIMYVLCQCSAKRNFGKTVLCSILYFIDSNYYELHGETITNETYIKSKRGITPKHFREVSSDLIENNQLFLKKEPYYSRTIHRYYPLIIPDVHFKSQEMEIINHSIKHLSNNNASTITRYATRDSPIAIANIGDEIDYRFVFTRNRKYSILNK